MFSSPNVEQAILNINSPQRNQASVEFINNWTQNPDSIFSSLELILKSNYEIVKLTCSTYLSHSIINFWNQINSEKKIIFHENIINFALNYNKMDQILKFIIKTIANIAIYDWPDEWPEFSLIINPPQNLNEQNYFNSVKVFHKFIKCVESSENITDQRRNLIKNSIIENIAVLFNYLNKYLEIPLLSKDALGIYSYLLLWIPNDEAILPQLLEKIFSTFLTNEETIKVSLKCLTSIFISRSDSSGAFSIYSPFLIKALSNSTFANQKPITSNDSVLQFVIRFLNVYITILEIVFVFEQAKNESRFSRLIDKSVNGLYQTIVSKGISLVDLKNDVIHLLQVILSIQSENIQDKFWYLWNFILKRFKFEILCKFAVKPVCLFYQPLYPMILQSLYNLLPSAINDGEAFIFQARGCFNSLFFINQEVFLQFLQAQAPSVNLCYAIGLLEFILDSNDNIRALSLIVYELLSTLKVDSMDPQYVRALLFCLPHSSVFFKDNNDMFARFIEFIIACINDNDSEISDAACTSLNYIVTNRIGLFKGDSKLFTENIIEQSERFFFHMNEKSALTMYKICIILICQNEQIKNSSAHYNRLIQPVMNFLANYLNQIKTIIQSNGDFSPLLNNQSVNESLEKAVLIITECTNAFYPEPYLFLAMVWPTMFELTILVVSNVSFQSEIVSNCLLAIAWIQSKHVLKEINEIQIMQQVFAAMVKRGRIEESIFNYITILKDCEEEESEELQNLFPFIFQTFILPIINSNVDFPFIPIFGMVTSFKLNPNDFQWIIAFIIKGIHDFRKDINSSSIQCIKNLLINAIKEQTTFIIENYEAQLITALIESITDDFHKLMILGYVEFLRTLITMNSEEQLNRIVKKNLLDSLKKCAKEPSDGFFENFVNYLFSICSFYTPFKEAFMNLLIVLRKASPGDTKLFEVEPVHQNIIYDDMIKITQEEIIKIQ